MSATYLPGMGSLCTLGEWIEQHEELLSQVMLVNPAPEREGDGFCAVFLSRDGRGEFLLRSCEGVDARWLVWNDQRRLRSAFGESYALAQMNLWLESREHAGYRIEWSAQRALQTEFRPATDHAVAIA